MFVNPCINLLVPPSATREYHPKVFQVLHLLQCIAAHFQHTLLKVLGETYYLGHFSAVIIFIPAWPHIAENRWNACWRPVVKMLSVPNRLRKVNGWPSSSRQWHRRRLGCGYLSNSYRLWKWMVTAHILVETHSHGEQLWFNSTDPHKLLIGNTVTWWPLTASNSTAVNTELPQQSSKLFTRNPIVGFSRSTRHV